MTLTDEEFGARLELARLRGFEKGAMIMAANLEAERAKFQAETLTTSFLAGRLGEAYHEHWPSMCDRCANKGIGVLVTAEGDRLWVCGEHNG